MKLEYPSPPPLTTLPSPVTPSFLLAAKESFATPAPPSLPHEDFCAVALVVRSPVRCQIGAQLLQELHIYVLSQAKRIYESYHPECLVHGTGELKV